VLATGANTLPTATATLVHSSLEGLTGCRRSC